MISITDCVQDVSPVTIQAIIDVESAGNQFVVANVTDKTSHFFDNQEKAVNFLDKLESENKKYSAGLMQIYVDNFNGLKLSNRTVFNYCENIKAGSEILKQCFLKAKKTEDNEQEALKNSLSCYYSGNFKTGYKKEEDGKSYVERVLSKVKKYTVPTLNGTNSIQQIPIEKTKKDWDVFGDY